MPGTGENRRTRSARAGTLALLVSSAALLVLAAPAMAAPPTFDQATPLTVEADGPDGWELNITASDDTDPSVAVTCAPALGTVLAIGGPHAVSCTATDDSADPAANNTNRNYQITVTDTTRSNLQIEKFASHQKASPGQHVTYSFRVTNHGPSDASGVTVRDPLSQHFNFISGDPGCSVTNGELVCTFGNVASGATATKNVVLQLHPTHHQGEAPNQHQLDVIKLEKPFQANAFVPAPGGYDEQSLQCPAGYTATDGSARFDAGDQNSSDQPGVSHEAERLHFVRSESNAADPRRWDFTLQNHNLGRAQGHLFVVCLRNSTSNNAGHAHNLNQGPPVTGVLTIPASGGRFEKTLSCGPGFVAIAPSFEFTTVGVPPGTPPFNKNGPHGPQYKSEQSPDGASWTFGFQTAAAARVELSIRCVSRYTSSAGGHTETLNFHHVYRRANVGGFSGDFGNSGPWTEARAECPVNYKGITATWRYPRHVIPLGNTPEPINRDFRIFNKSPLTKWARIDLNCLKITTRDDLNGGSVRNTATTYGDQPDWDFANNLDFFDLEDPPLEGGGDGSGAGSGGSDGGDGSGSGAGSGDGSGSDGGGGGAADSGKVGLRLGDAVTPAGKKAMVPVYGGDDPSEGTVKLSKGKKRLGKADFALDAGEDAYVDVKLKKKGRKVLRKKRSVRVTVDTDDGTITEKLRVAR